MGSLKGQNFRICIYDTTAEKYKVIGMATGCTVMLNDIPADTKYSVGAVGRKADGSSYTLRVDII